MPVIPIPTNPTSLRRDYLDTAREVAIRMPTEANIARLIALTQALLRDVTGEPAIEIRIGVPRHALQKGTND